MRKRLLAGLLALCIMLSLCPVVLAAESYEFRPDITCTQGEFIDFLWRVNGQPEPKCENNPFEDVADDCPYLKPILWAVEQGIAGLIGSTQFGPNESCTRGRIALFLWAANGRPEPKTTMNPFSDVSGSDYYFVPVLWVIENGIMGGIGANKFGPNNSCTRAQVVTFLWAANGKPEPASMDNPFKDVADDAWYTKPVQWAYSNGVIRLDTPVVPECNHSETVLPAKEATCTETGRTEGVGCAICGKVLEAQQTIPAKGHRFSGSKCTVCGAVVNQFGPNEACTNGRFILYLWRMAGCPLPVTMMNPFSDLSASDSYYQAVIWAVERGITGGIGDGQFGGSKNITRGKIILELWRYNGAPEPMSDDNPFVDVSETDEYYKAVLWGRERGITGVISANRFGPDNSCTRAQIITYLYAASGKPATKNTDIPFADVSKSDWYAHPILWAYENDIIRLGDPLKEVCVHTEKVLPAKEASCEQSGLTEGKICSQCGEILVKQEIIPAKEHDYVGVVITAPTCKDYGLKQYVCKNDASHTYNELLEPTEEHNYSEGKCTVCGAADPDYVAPTPTPPAVDNPFTDVADDAWYAAPVLWAKANNVTGGKTETTFGPDDGCTRAQVVTFLSAANGKPEPKSLNNPFTDVADDAWYVKPVLWAVEQGITGGVAEGKFGPEQTCTRAQIATFLYAAAGKPEVKGGSTFSDVADSDWFAKPIIWAAENEVTGGIGDGKFGPSNTCTRAQVVTFLYKVYGNN